MSEHVWRWMSDEDWRNISAWRVKPEDSETLIWGPVNVICDKCGETTWAHGRMPFPQPRNREESLYLSKTSATTSEETPGTDPAAA